MVRNERDQRTVDAAAADARQAQVEFDNSSDWLDKARKGPMHPIAAEVWALDEALQHVLLVRHQRRGWVPPGGKVERGETPRAAAGRELVEETGLTTDLFAVPAAVFLRSYRADWDLTLGLSYAAVLDSSLPVVGEPRQPATWVSLDHDWQGAFPEDRTRIRDYAARLTQARWHFAQ